jgi:hypothetical protein
MQTGLFIEKADPIDTISNFNRRLKVDVIFFGMEHVNTLFGKVLVLNLTFNFLYQISKCQGRGDLNMPIFLTRSVFKTPDQVSRFNAGLHVLILRN